MKEADGKECSLQAFGGFKNNVNGTESLLSCTSLKASWRALLMLQPQAWAATCLHKMIKNEECYNVMDKRLATYRLVRILLRILKNSVSDGGMQSKFVNFEHMGKGIHKFSELTSGHWTNGQVRKERKMLKRESNWMWTRRWQ